MKTYAEAIAYLYSRLPMFTRDGASAYKKDLDRTIALCGALGNPQNSYKTIHVAGTNGKGSSSHMLAGILATAGYKTGLYTSPHLVDFRERIRTNGRCIDERFVVDYVNSQRDLIEKIQPSFFEATVAMAFEYFAQQQVDVAVIEVGLGGRLDSTNIIFPEVSLITNIGMDHMNLLGDTLSEIASEKAGIIKPGTPVVVSEYQGEIAHIFEEISTKHDAPLLFAAQRYNGIRVEKTATKQQIVVRHVETEEQQILDLDLTGSYQINNVIGVLATVDVLKERGFTIGNQQVRQALSQVQKLTGFQGRWQTLSTSPLIICDTGHNEDGIKQVVHNLQEVSYNTLHMVIGAMADKDLDHMLPFMPKEAVYYFSSPDMPRAMAAIALQQKAHSYGLEGMAYASVLEALSVAKSSYQDGDLIFIGGSTFVVAEVLASLA